MSLERNKQIATRFIEALGRGRVDETPFTDDFAAWTASSGNVPGPEYRRRAKFVKNCTESTTDHRDRRDRGG